MPVAFDAIANSAETTGTSKTWSHTTSGSDRYLHIGDTNYASTADNFTGATYAGVSMTALQNVASAATRMWSAGLAAPASGANNVVVSFSASTSTQASSQSYTGVNQVSTPDSQGSAFVNSNTTLSKSLTSVANNCWLIAVAQNTTDGSISATSGTTQRTDGTKGFGAFDLNAVITPAGSASIGVDISPAGTITLCAAMIAPVPPVTSHTKLLPLLGVG